MTNADIVTPADIAAELMLDAARDIDALAISERLDETEMPDEPDGFAEQVAELVETASITIEWPDTTDGTINVGTGPVGTLVAKLGQERNALGVKVDDLTAEIGKLRDQLFAQKPVIDAAQAWAEAHEDNDLVRRIRRPSAHPAVAGLYDAVEQYRLMDAALTTARDEQTGAGR